MKLATIVIQVVLVAAGIFVYDSLRQDSRSDLHRDVDDDVERPGVASEPNEEPEVSDSRLAGVGLERLLDRMLNLERRVGAIEHKERTFTRVTTDPHAPIASAPSEALPTPSAVPGGGALPKGEGGAYDEATLAWFRSVKTEVERQERHERFTTMIGNQVDHLGLSLTSQQRNNVVLATLSYRDRLREVIRSTSGKGMRPEERQQGLEGLRSEYERTIHSLVPAADAEKIVASLGRYPGLNYRRARGSNR